MSVLPLVTQLVEFPEAVAEELKLADTAIYVTYWSNGKVSFCKMYNNPTSNADIMMDVDFESFLKAMKIFVENVNNVREDEGYTL